MDLNDLTNLGKSLLEGYLERAVGAARFAERQCRKAVETYDFVADMLPLPLPKLGSDPDPVTQYEPPPAPLFSCGEKTSSPERTSRPKPAEVTGVPRVKTQTVLPRQAPATSKPAPPPKKAAPTKAAPTKAAPKKAAPTKAAPTKAAPKKAAPTKAALTKAAPTKAAPTKAALKPPFARAGLSRLRKQELQTLCRRYKVSYQQSDTVKVLIGRLLELS